MLYQFNGFVFNIESLVLTKDGDSIEIRHNEAKLLALFLQHADSVLTKEEILNQVWQDKVVSEQAVFQNISHLRTLFGTDAIKTFPKRGYQWLLPFKLVTKAPPSTDPEPLMQAPATASSKHKSFISLLSVAIVLVAVTVLGAVFYHKTPAQIPNIQLGYIPITDANKEPLLLPASSKFSVTELTRLTYQQFMKGPEVEYASLKAESPFVLTGKVRTYEHKVYLDFLLKGAAGEWSGFLSAASEPEVMLLLKQHLNQDFIYEFVNEKNAFSINQAKLSLAHETSPDDFIVLSQLIDIYRRMDESDKAMVLAEKLEQQAREKQDWQQVGNALIKQMQVLTSKNVFNLAQQKFDLALTEFIKINDISLQAKAWAERSLLALYQDDYPTVKSSLLMSAKLASEINDIEKELHALTYLSVLAHKNHREQDKYLYLAQAEAKMREYDLPTYRYAKIPFHHSIYAESAAAREPHYKRVLEYMKLTPDHWVAQSSRRSLVIYLIEQNRTEEAKVIVDSVTSDNAENSYINALLAKAMKQSLAFSGFAKKAFEQAELVGDKWLSLEIALMLCEQPDSPANYDYYSQYINDNATANWRKSNETKLMALNL